MPKTKEPELKGWDLLATYCPQCDAACCKYFAFEIDEPEDEEELDKVFWFLVHEGATVFVDEGKWYLQISNKCRYLAPDGRCGIYEKRPQVCREYGLGEDGEPNCEFTGHDYGYDMEFKTPEAFLIYKNAYMDELSKLEEKEERKRTRKLDKKKRQTDTKTSRNGQKVAQLKRALPRKMNRKARSEGRS